MKRCCDCKQEKSLNEFYPAKGRESNVRSNCKECSKKSLKNWQAKNPQSQKKSQKEFRNRNLHWKWAINTLHSHRKKSSIFANFSVQDLKNEALDIKTCAYCGEILVWDHVKSKSNCPSLDRINNEKHLTLGNIIIVCLRCNTTKSNNTLSEFYLKIEKIQGNLKSLLDIKEKKLNLLIGLAPIMTDYEI